MVSLERLNFMVASVMEVGGLPGHGQSAGLAMIFGLQALLTEN
jgi:hypothetical protein